MKKGTQVLFPTSACHYCEDFYPEPERFNPERFLKDNAKNLDPANFRPFGGKLPVTESIVLVLITQPITNFKRCSVKSLNK